ncbi:MAG: hypothetical protein AAGF94_15445 [Pseudomonadota bacterium]
MRSFPGIVIASVMTLAAHSSHAASFTATSDAKLELTAITTSSGLVFDDLDAFNIDAIEIEFGTATATALFSALTMPPVIIPGTTVPAVGDNYDLSASASGSATFPSFAGAFVANFGLMEITNVMGPPITLSFKFDYEVSASVGPSGPLEFGFAIAFLDLLIFSDGDITELGTSNLVNIGGEDYEFFADSAATSGTPPPGSPPLPPGSIPPIMDSFEFTVLLEEDETFFAGSLVTALGGANFIPPIPVPPALPMLGTAVLALIGYRRWRRTV